MTIISIGLGFVLIFLILSLMVSGILDFISKFLSLKSTYLWEGIKNMLGSKVTQKDVDSAAIDLVTKFESHHLMSSASIPHAKSKSQGKPNYLEAESFSTILIHILDGTDLKSLSETITRLPTSELKSFLEKTTNKAGSNLETVKTDVKNWYNEVMTQVSAAYKLRIKKIGLVVSIALVIGFNADSFSIYNRISKNSITTSNASQIIEMATSFSKSDTYLGLVSGQDSTRGEQTENGNFTNSVESATKLESLLESMTNNYSPLGVGWTSSEWKATISGGFMSVLIKLLGFALTIVAISMGAPFWYDVLKKITRT